MTLGQARACQDEHQRQDANQGREQALLLRMAQHAKKRDFETLIGDLYGAP